MVCRYSVIVNDIKAVGVAYLAVLIAHCLGLAFVAKHKATPQTRFRDFLTKLAFPPNQFSSTPTGISRPCEGILKVFIASVSRQIRAVTNGRDVGQCSDKAHKIGYMPQ